MSIRSITPRTSCSEPIGISVATACGPKLSLICSSVRKKSARSRSSMFTNTSRDSPSSAARVQRRFVFTSTPITPLITNTADSQTRSAAIASATNDGSPGVSISLTLRPSHWNDARLDAIDIWRAFSSGAESDTVVPSATEPRRLTAPASNRSASFRDVFPLPRWPTNATLRILSAGMAFSYTRQAERTMYTSDRAERYLVEQVGLKSRLQAQHRFRVELRNSRFRDAEDLADLAERQVLVVVEGHDELLALGQSRDGVREAVLHLGGVHRGRRIDRVRVLDRVEQRDLVAGRVRERPQLVESHDRAVRDAGERLLKLLDRHLELRGHLGVGRRAVELVLELRVRLLDLSSSRTHAAPCPVDRPQQVEDRAPDARHREGLELDLARGVEALDRRDQAEQAVRDEVGLLDVRGQAGRHPSGHVLHERGERQHELLPRALVAIFLVAAPELLELDRLDVRFQAFLPALRPWVSLRVGLPQAR